MTTNIDICVDTRCAKCDRTFGDHPLDDDNRLACPGQGSDVSYFEAVESKVTVLEFFSSMIHGAKIFSNSETDQYLIFVNFDWQDGEYKFVNLVSPKWATLTKVPANDENRWETRFDDEGDVLIVSDAERTLATAILNLRDMGIENAKELDAKRVESETLRSDFVKLNEHLIGYANENQMCSDFEARLWQWNNDFEMMKLYGRKRDTSVAITVGDSTEAMWIAVEARTPEEAKIIVSNMERRDIIQKLLNDGSGFWGLPNFTFRTQDEQYSRNRNEVNED